MNLEVADDSPLSDSAIQALARLLVGAVENQTGSDDEPADRKEPER